MTNELVILEALKDVIVNNANTYLPEGYSTFTSSDVVIEFPDSDNMPSDVAVFIQGDSASYESLSTTTDASMFSVSVFVIGKRDTSANLTIKMYTYFNAIYETLRKSMSLDGNVDFASITGAEFYPAIEGNKNVQGVEISCALQYTKDF